MYNTDAVRQHQAFSPLVVAAAIYSTITFSLSKLLGIMERLRAGDSSI